MATHTIEKQLRDLTRHVVLLRSAVIGLIGERDPEGEYRPEFVWKILKLARQKRTGVKFAGAADFLKRIG